MDAGNAKPWFFPNGFRPNNDGLSDYFGPYGNLIALKDYMLRIYYLEGRIIFKVMIRLRNGTAKRTAILLPALFV